MQNLSRRFTPGAKILRSRVLSSQIVPTKYEGLATLLHPVGKALNQVSENQNKKFKFCRANICHIFCSRPIAAP